MSTRERCVGCHFCGYDPAPDCIYYCLLGRSPSKCDLLPGRSMGGRNKRSLAGESVRRKKRKGA